MYKAEIISTRINKGVLIVEVLFSSNEDSFTTTFETNQYQDHYWIGEQIEKKIQHLNSLDLVKKGIIIGEYSPTIKPDKTEREIYQEKTQDYLNFMNKARMGIIAYDRPIINELREWLRENFKDEYISI